jgi:hypothetical protein
MMQRFVAVLAVAIASSQSTGAGKTPLEPATAMTAAKWSEDLAVYRAQMPKIHGNLFHTMTQEQFRTALDVLEKRLPHLTSNQVKTEIMRLVALVHDGHTRLRQETLGNHMLPVRLHFFADGLYVEAADKSYANLVGGQVTRIGAISAAEAYAAVRPLIPVDKDNEDRRRLLAPDLLVTPELMQAIGATDTDAEVSLTVEKSGRVITASLPAGPLRPWKNHGWPAEPEGWLNARHSSNTPVPIWLRHTDKNYWHEFLNGGRTLYIQYNQVEDERAGEPIASYFPRVFREAEAKGVERVILDLRLNGGGNNELNRPIWHALIKSKRLNQKGKLWVLTGPQTFSAAMNCVDEIEMNTHALFAGEPTGETPNMWGDPADLRLPNSGIVIQASTLWWQLEDPRDDRPFRAPDLLVGLRFADYVRNVDPVMRAVDASIGQKQK